MSANEALLIAVGVFQLAFGIVIGWLRWGSQCRLPKHDWRSHHFGFSQWESCERCGRAR